MARKRAIDPMIWDDLDLAKLTREERLLFIGLFSLADDYGHITAHPAILKKSLFGYDADLTVEQVEVMRDHIAEKCQNVMLYEHQGQQYFWLKTWERHQDLRYRAKAQYPCHHCGKYHTSDDFHKCPAYQGEIIPETTQELPPEPIEQSEDLRTSCTDIAHICSPREESRVEKSSVEESREKRDGALGKPKAPVKPPPIPLETYEIEFLRLFEFRSGRFPTKAMREAVNRIAEKYGSEEFLAAAQKAAEGNVRKLAYVEGILKRGGVNKNGRANQTVRSIEPPATPGKYAAFNHINAVEV